MSRKRLKDMLRKEMDERIKTYDTKPVEKPSLKFDLKTDLLGKTEVPPVASQVAPELKPILKQAEKVIEEPEKKTKEEEPLKRFNKYLEEDDDDDYSSSSESDYSESEHSDDAEDIYKQYKNKVNKIDEKINSRKVEKPDENKVKKDIDRRKEDERKDDRKKVENERDRRRDDRDEPRRRDDRDEPRRRDDRDEPRRRDDRDEPRRRDDRDEPRRRDDRDEPRRRDDRDEPRRRDDRDEPRRRDDRDEPRRRDELPSREVVQVVHKGNQFLDLPKRYILQTIKNRDVDTISADCVDEIKDILQDFTSHMFELFSEGDKVVIAERDDVRAYIGLFIEDEDKEMVNDLILPSKDIELAINNISDTYNVKIKKDVIYLVHMFLESILAKVIDGAKLINEMCKTKRLSGKEIKTAYKIYML